MSRGIYVALSGAVAQQGSLEATATNLANAQTAGYSKLRPIFREMLRGASDGQTPLRYTEMKSTALDTAPGALRTTGRSLDVALPESTYLAVATPRGERYTRGGALELGPDGTLRTMSGVNRRIHPSNGSSPANKRPVQHTGEPAGGA